MLPQEFRGLYGNPNEPLLLLLLAFKIGGGQILLESHFSRGDVGCWEWDRSQCILHGVICFTLSNTDEESSRVSLH